MTRKNDVKYALKHGRRGVLLRWCRAKYKEAGGPPDVKTAKGMVSFLSGKPQSQLGAWTWLMKHHESGAEIVSLGKATKSRIFAKRPGNAFYLTDDWRRLRFDALKKSSGACCLCGRSNREHGIVLHVDHIKPKSLYPELALDLTNLQVLCEDCNMGKGNRDETDWRAL